MAFSCSLSGWPTDHQPHPHTHRLPGDAASSLYAGPPSRFMPAGLETQLSKRLPISLSSSSAILSSSIRSAPSSTPGRPVRHHDRCAVNQRVVVPRAGPTHLCSRTATISTTSISAQSTRQRIPHPPTPQLHLLIADCPSRRRLSSRVDCNVAHSALTGTAGLATNLPRSLHIKPTNVGLLQ